MPLNPGTDSFTFSFEGVVADKYHKVTPQGSQSVSQGGCNLQPLGVNDEITNTQFTEATHRLLTPYTDGTKTVRAEWLAQHNSVTYRVLGVKWHEDNFGRGLHITMILKEESG